jgi:hypothetical protein
MALSFNKAAGGAKKSSITSYAYRDGDNEVRLEAILTAAEDLGDPTDPETGWDVKFKRVKTGPLPYNVEYQLQVLKCKQRALSESEMAAIADLKSMDDVMPRPTPDAQKTLLDEIRQDAAGDIDESLEDEFNIG